MPGPKKTEAAKPAPANRFSVLADSDSDVETSNQPQQSTSPVPGSATLPELPKGGAPSSPPFRTWPKEVREGAEKSPFHRQKRRGPRKENEDGWVSLKTMETPSVKESEEVFRSITVTYEPRTPPFFEEPEAIPARTPPGEFDDIDLPPPIVRPDQTFPSLLSRGACTLKEEDKPIQQPEIILHETISRPKALEELSALAWAERVKKSLEKAEGPRIAAVTEERTFGRLSFFRSK